MNDRQLNIRFEESRGVRRCRECKVSMHPGVLTFKCMRLIMCRFSKTGQAYEKQYYCLICAEKILNLAITLTRERALSLKSKNSNNGARKLISRTCKDVKEYKKMLKFVQNWKRFFDQITDKTRRSY